MDAGIKTEVFMALRKILEPYAKKMVLVHDSADNYYLNCKKEVKKGMPVFFAAVRIGKNYVSYHLMPVYGNPVLLKDTSAELLKRMQGKSCFNFKKAEPELFRELKALTERGYKGYEQMNWI